MLRKVKCLNVNKNDLSELGKSNNNYSPSTQIQNRSLSRGRISSLSQQRNCKKIIKMIESPQSLKFKDQAMINIQNLKQQYSEYKKNKDPLRYLKKSLYTKGIRHSKIDLTCMGFQTDRNTLGGKPLHQSQTQIKKSVFNQSQLHSQNDVKTLNKIDSVILMNSQLKPNRKIKGIKVLLCKKRQSLKITNSNQSENKKLL